MAEPTPEPVAEPSKEEVDLIIQSAIQNGVFNQYLEAFVSVFFDAIDGQKVELAYPSSFKLTKEEESQICYHAFPDSMSMTVGDCNFSFRIIDSQGKSLFGYVMCRQRKDSQYARGYFQKSLVLLARKPWYDLHSWIIKTTGPPFFECGVQMLEAIAHNISKWPEPTAGSILELPLVGQVKKAHIPIVDVHAFSSSGVALNLTINLYQNPLIYVLEHLWTLWELMLRGESLIVVAASPSLASEAVIALTSLINPLPFCGDVRPFYTIHDTDIKVFTTPGREIIEGTLLGVSNPYFVKLTSHWPNLLSISPEPQSKLSASQKEKRPSLLTNMYCKLWTPLKPMLKAHQPLIDSLSVDRTAGGMHDEICSSMMRGHFRQMTEAFLLPFERYFTVTMPSWHDHGLKGFPSLLNFDEERFLDIIEQSPPTLFKRVKIRRLRELYNAFIHSIHFPVFFETQRQSRLSQTYASLHAGIPEEDMLYAMRSQGSMVLVDFAIKLRERRDMERSLIRTGCAVQNSPAAIVRIDQIFAIVRKVLPPDTVQALRIDPASLEVPVSHVKEIEIAGSNLSSITPTGDGCVIDDGDDGAGLNSIINPALNLSITSDGELEEADDVASSLPAMTPAFSSDAADDQDDNNTFLTNDEDNQ